MDPDSYAKDLCRLADSYSAGEISSGEWKAGMAKIREARIERNRDPERQP